MQTTILKPYVSFNRRGINEKICGLDILRPERWGAIFLYRMYNKRSAPH